MESSKAKLANGLNVQKVYMFVPNVDIHSFQADPNMPIPPPGLPSQRPSERIV
ncbi:hypothetical protein F2P79_025526 [Pimephales promelas]|nr:hypothetical protein F2P79_025526 [Pimephales promelas]